jgi:hypothetical protein
MRAYLPANTLGVDHDAELNVRVCRTVVVVVEDNQRRIRADMNQVQTWTKDAFVTCSEVKNSNSRRLSSVDNV